MIEITVGRKKLRLPNVDDRIFRYYSAVAPAILPHLKRRTVFMTLPGFRPPWIRACDGFPVVQDLGALLWLANTGGGALRVSAARCDDPHRPDYLEFDASPGAALQLRDVLSARGLTAYAKTAEADRIHVYAPIRRGPTHAQADTVAAEIARAVPGARACRSLPCVYSMDERGRVSAPVTWEEVEHGVRADEFRMDNLSARLREVGELWRPLTLARGRASINRMIRSAAA
jgi:DNA primase